MPRKGSKQMNEEYLAAKANLCLNQAEIDLKQEEIAKAIKNLERANSALSRLFGLKEEETLQERADRTNPYLLTTKEESNE
jgi:outer membrane protein TolC